MRAETRRSPRRPARAASLAAGAAAAAVLLATPAAAGAQDAPSAPGRPPAWTFALTGQQLWESNARFQAADGAGDLASRAGASVVREWQGRRGRVALSAAGDVMRFQEQSDLNRFTYGAGAELARRLSQRLDAQAAYAMRVALARDLAPVADAGVLLPLTLSRASSASGGLAYRLSPAAAARVETRYDAVTFDSRALDNGWSAGARLGVDRQTGRAGRVGVGYEFVHSNSLGRHGDTHGLSARWERQLTSRIGAQVDAGVLRVAPIGGGRASVLPQGGAELRVRGGQSTFGARYSRAASQVFGLGRVLATHQFGATYDREVSATLGVALDASRTVGDDPAEDGFGITSDAVAASLRYALARNLSLSGGLFFRRRELGAPEPAVAGHGVTLSFAYGAVLP